MSKNTLLRVRAGDVRHCFGPSGLPSRRQVSLSTWSPPSFVNEAPKLYLKGSSERAALEAELKRLNSALPVDIPIVCEGRKINEQLTESQANPARHKEHVARFAAASSANVDACVDAALVAGRAWAALPFQDRADVFLKAADLVATKNRAELVASTMLGQGKNVWQAEIDAAAEICDFFRAYVSEGHRLQHSQDVVQTDGVKNEIEYRPLGGFVYAVSPFNFTALGATLVGAPLIMGNPVIWKPSPYAVHASWLLHQTLLEAGLPPDVVQFVPGDAESVTATVLKRQEFTGLSFIGSTTVLKRLIGKIGQGTADGVYQNYPRVVGETGGKNFHLIHASADVRNAALQTVRGAFELAGQKCSACSRVYVPESIWPAYRDILIQETNALRVGEPEEFANFVGPVIHERAFDSLEQVLGHASSDPALEILTGGTVDKSTGYFVNPTIIKTEAAEHSILQNELFGPILAVHVYPDAKWNKVLELVDKTSRYALSGSIFARDAAVIEEVKSKLAQSAGNFYVNAKCTGAVVMQQPFGGSRDSGTNDKTGTMALLQRWTSTRTISTHSKPLERVLYPSNES